MIPVKRAKEPKSFDREVRRKGKAWLRKHPNAPLKPFWTACLDQLWKRYGGVCAFQATHFERVSGAGSVDHFIAKSSKRSLAYEWGNYRLACRDVNGRKSSFDDVLDPFQLRPNTFQLVLITGHIHPNPALPASQRAQAEDTIRRLGLDRPLAREMRRRHYEELASGRRLPKYSPFVWTEMERQSANG